MILSFDVGIKNLAYCIVNGNTIYHWKVLDIGPPNGSDGPTHLIKILDTLPELLETHIVLIEKQPSRNNKMRIIEAMLHAYFIIKGTTNSLSSIKKVIVYSAKHKLGSETIKGKKGYAQRKKLSVERTQEFLTQQPQTSEIQNIFKNSKKKDDLADSLLQALAFTKNVVHKEISSEPIELKISARKPTEKQEKSGYSMSNLKWIFKDKNEAEQDKLSKQPKIAKSMKRWFYGKSLKEILVILNLAII
tara:strand:- start:1592 stop:2332 length:741 start_codon:yes stop_codon:yes gene_type:complete